ncbi:hypothetical protein PHYSODRAFT_328238 [Phytophthora sojae]|uniref:Uncharacterized protein n=1 Tax=Phytophthora sojae (strain P6497) TaxID=1094619 RepID=G4Z352_PHYSP|nr:hypothetical protein PHYSODRAFT_328238 [Phytophthora sojae]EGZ20081.1 hypothetical protein PHYSODRAFT_328238 [Phytophthora sojae]|eukprot:XP_009522798.1 hypothetical protein PHYSODRAFT_328238 [Phytophthora sojae]
MEVARNLPAVTTEIVSFSDSVDQLRSINAEVVAISTGLHLGQDTTHGEDDKLFGAALRGLVTDEVDEKLGATLRGFRIYGRVGNQVMSINHEPRCCINAVCGSEDVQKEINGDFVVLLTDTKKKKKKKKEEEEEEEEEQIYYQCTNRNTGNIVK